MNKVTELFRTHGEPIKRRDVETAEDKLEAISEIMEEWTEGMVNAYPCMLRIGEVLKR